MKQSTLVNGRDWWKQRYTDDAHLTYMDPGATIYWSGDPDARWIIEAANVTWEAPAYPGPRDDRHFPGLQEYFGDAPSMWKQTNNAVPGF